MIIVMDIGRLPQLSNEQLNKLSDICSDLGVVAVASVFIPSLFDSFSGLAALMGMVLALLFFFISLKLS